MVCEDDTVIVPAAPPDAGAVPMNVAAALARVPSFVQNTLPLPVVVDTVTVCDPV